MTLVIAAAGPAFFGMVSDRLVTLSVGERFAGEPDTIANKNIVLQREDAVAVMGYSGSAYVRGVPINQWIAETLTGQVWAKGCPYQVARFARAEARHKTVQGGFLTARMMGSRIMLIDAKGGMSLVTQGNVFQWNEVIHVTDAVSIPG